jgi:DNA-binding phage protein
MKAGKSLIELATEIQRQADSKRDYIADTRTLELTGRGQLAMDVNETQITVDVTPHTHNQIAQRVGIPSAYYKRMQAEAPQLLATNVNTWFNDKPERRMVRTLDGNARAFLSDRYRIIDHYEILETVLPVVSEMGLEKGIVSTEITDNRIYFKVINQRLELEVQKGDVVQAGFVISNSETGMGALKVEPLIYRLVCTNGMISQDYSQKRYHVGRAAASEDEAYELYADETLRADDAAFLLKVRDTVRAAVDITQFTKIVERMRESIGQKIEGNPVKAVEVASKTFGLNQGESSGILTHLIQGGDLSAYGLLNAITRTAQDVESYDRATELETMGSKVLALPKSTWKEIAYAQ